MIFCALYQMLGWEGSRLFVVFMSDIKVKTPSDNGWYLSISTTGRIQICFDWKHAGSLMSRSELAVNNNELTSI